MATYRMPTFVPDAAMEARLRAAAPAPLVYAGDAVLRGQAKAVPRSALASEEIRQLLAVMIQTMRKAPGVGLAAPQIGVDLAIAVLEDAPAYFGDEQAAANLARGRVPLPLCVMVNPQVKKASGSRAVSFVEGCLSVPHYAAEVRRELAVEVGGLDAEGTPFNWRAEGWPARIVQHEVDHLRGLLYVDRMASKTLTYDRPKAR